MQYIEVKPNPVEPGRQSQFEAYPGPGLYYTLRGPSQSNACITIVSKEGGVCTWYCDDVVAQVAEMSAPDKPTVPGGMIGVVPFRDVESRGGMIHFDDLLKLVAVSSKPELVKDLVP